MSETNTSPHQHTESRNKTVYSITWTPNQAELLRHESEDLLYVCLIREQLSVQDFLTKYRMTTSHNCHVYFIPPGTSNKQAEILVRSMLDTLADSAWVAPAGSKVNTGV